MATITDQVGRVLGGRYRVENGIGTGASAYVYAGTDLVLQRRVALKVLQPGLGSDEGFLRRFRVEAQAAAALVHPHVLRVLDWGEDADGAFLVLEYLAGGSLRDLLDAGARLDHAQVARIGAEAAHGLAYAHRRGLVHRDVKPANLMLDEDGHVRVADFGLARALAEAAWTEPLGAVLGTARYASPEQAEGRTLDDRSDVYSLALVLFEALVGRVPFAADTTISTLMARVGAALPRAAELGPLAPILAQAAIPEPLARLDAAELAVELELLRRALPPPAPLPLAGRCGPAAPSDPRPRPEPAAAGQGEPVGAPAWAPAPAGARDDVATPAAPARRSRRARAGGARPRRLARRSRRARAGGARPRRLARRLAALGALAALVAAAAVGYRLVVVDGHRVPAVRGDSLAVARRLAVADGLAVRVAGHRYSAAVPAGAVLAQSPSPGARVHRGTLVALELSLGHAPVSLPQGLAGTGGASAVRRLRLAGFVVELRRSFDDAVPAGRVVALRPAAGPAPYGSPVRVVLSRGPALRTVPAIPAGAGWVATEGTLAALGLRPHERLAWSETYAAGEVLSVSPASGTTRVPDGSAVLVVVSRGAAPRTIPPLPSGTTWEAAAASLSALRLDPVEVRSFSDSVPYGEVVSISPAPGTSGVPVGSTVDVVVSRGPLLVAVPVVAGDSIADAVAAVQAQGLVVSEQIGPPFATKATTTDPAPGSDVRPGSSVTLYVA